MLHIIYTGTDRHTSWFSFFNAVRPTEQDEIFININIFSNLEFNAVAVLTESAIMSTRYVNGRA